MGGGATGTRMKSAGVTADLTEIWPQVRPRLIAYLRARGVTYTNADDVVQDVAERMVRHDVPFADAEDLLRWCVPVARNASIDQHRRASRAVLVANLPDRAREDDVAETVSARLRLRRVIDGLNRLPQSERAALTAAIDNTDGLTDSATRVRRHRARRRLLEMAGPPAVVVACGRVLRRLWRPGVATAIPAAMAVSFVVGAMHAPSVDRPAAAPVPAVVRPATHPLAVTTTVVRRTASASTAADAGSAATASRSAGTGSAVNVQAPAPVAVQHHPRGAGDKGTVCIGWDNHVDETCIGPSGLPPIPAPAIWQP